ncbi:ribosome small subunit-dependent GTPase A [Flagellimonas algicola]|uniref:Small ribosomal subunit biogenesis GTPase RsgA n=1 Tax=Flagellimonas algicola TaxID=2583815 RepID=A0ABY2WPE7_9FLAO|nr:ribosome small subunit-dependent GTPase A [Allomuricauda algicola]TMU56617.1 ribosome small subunit-dependent GTPase A [Allomuricauda algicola]
MKLEALGYNNEIKNSLDIGLEGLEIGRVITEHKERYLVQSEKGEFEAEITGNLRYTAAGRADFPAVGDWVALMVFDTHSAIIHKVLPRFSVLSRKAVGVTADIQIIATNIDFAFIVLSVDEDFSLNRMERYLTLCHSSCIQPIIILNKMDLVAEDRLSELMGQLKNRFEEIPVLGISASTTQGLKRVREIIEVGKTYCLLGSSGVGKSTLVNALSQKRLMETKKVSDYSKKGRHTTTHRELVVLENGGILIDNPGMREVGLPDVSNGLDKTFEDILDLAAHCKFKDCTHTVETGCAVTQAVESGDIDKSAYENYLKLKREQVHFDSTIAEKRKKDKDFGKMIKHFKYIKKSNK